MEIEVMGIKIAWDSSKLVILNSEESKNDGIAGVIEL